jgi:phosphatidate cytidylyltransferase
LSNLVIRAITGAVFVGLVVGAILLGSLSFYLLFLAFLIACMLEFYRLAKLTGNRPQTWLGIGTAIILFSMSFMFSLELFPAKFFLILIPILVMFFVSELYLYNKRPFSSLGYSLLGILYIALPFALLNVFVFKDAGEPFFALQNQAELDFSEDFITSLRLFQSNDQIVYNPDKLLAFFIIIWLYDTFAYLIGIKIGRHRLFERVSPKKSWEGTIGGLIVTVGISLLFPYVFKEYTMLQWGLFAFITAVAATFGDLIESLFKRSINVKDSGVILPGHGGMLDRFDSVLIAAPVSFIFIVLNS